MRNRRSRVLVVGMLMAAMLVTTAVPAHADGNMFCTWFPNRCGDTRKSDADRYATRAANGVRRATRATVQTAGPIFHNAAQPLREASRVDIIDPWEGPFERDGVRERRDQHRRQDGRGTHRRWKHEQGQRQRWRHGGIRRQRMQGGRHHRLRPQYVPSDQ